MNLLLVSLLLATQAPGAQDTVAQVLLRLEGDGTVGLTHRDAALFRRLLADGFIYTEDDRTLGRDDVLRDVAAGPDTVETAHNEDMKVHRFGRTTIVTAWLVATVPQTGRGAAQGSASGGRRRATRPRLSLCGRSSPLHRVQPASGGPGHLRPNRLRGRGGGRLSRGDDHRGQHPSPLRIP